MVKRIGVLFIATLVCTVMLIFPASVVAVEFQVPDTNTQLNLGGYIKLDVIYNDASAGDNDQANIEYAPSGVPLDENTSGEKDHLILNGRESRLWVKTSTPTDLGPMKTHLEFDFDSNEGDQVVSNSHHGQIRHAYATLNNWLFGRTWSLFMHLDSLPEINDFGGPTGSMFIRQAQVRYRLPLDTNSYVAFGLENPETYLADRPDDPAVAIRTVEDDLVAIDDGIFPDVIVRYNVNPTWGNLSAALMVRQLVFKEAAPGVDDTTFTISSQVGCVYKIGPSDIVKGAISYGNGLGRYSSLASHPDAVVTNGNGVTAVQQIAGFGGYEHIWGGTANWRSNFILGYSKADDPSELADSDLTEKTLSLHANLLMNPVPGARLGIEYLRASRETYGGQDGDLNRFQFSAMYVF